MARRKQLGSIANGIVSSFNSRNNDVDGYWGIGKLYKFVEMLDSKVISIELKAQKIEPGTNQFEQLLTYYLNMLNRLLERNGIPSNWIQSVKITAQFEAKYQQKHHFWRSALGNPCNLKCDILDDKGRHHIAHAYNNCRPHDPNKETRSNRVRNFESNQNEQ